MKKLVLKSAFISSSLVPQSKDESIQGTSPFQERYESLFHFIVGLPDGGESVLGNAITRALNYVKLDVGGSHSRETVLLGGIEHKLKKSVVPVFIKSPTK